MESKLVFVGVVVFFYIFGVMARARLQTILPSTQFHNWRIGGKDTPDGGIGSCCLGVACSSATSNTASECD